MVRGRNRATRAVRLAHGPELAEGCRALDRGRVHTRRLVDVVHASVGRHCALECEARGRVVRAEVFINVVLDKRVCGPSVDGEVAVTVGFVVGVKGDISGIIKMVNRTRNTRPQKNLTGQSQGSIPFRLQSSHYQTMLRYIRQQLRWCM